MRRGWREGIRNLLFEAIGYSDNSVLDQRDVEVEEQSQALVSKFEIGQKLTAMNGRDYFDGLNLNDDLVIYNQSGEESCMNVDLFVDNRNSLLPTNMKPSLFQFPGQSGFVYRL